MEKIKYILKHFLVLEIIPIVILLVLFVPSLTKGQDFALFLFVLLIIYVSISNLIISTIFSFITISKILSVSAIILFLCIICFLFYLDSHYKNYVDIARPFSEHSFIGHNIWEILIFLCLLINQLLVKFYDLIWDKINLKKTLIII